MFQEFSASKISNRVLSRLSILGLLLAVLVYLGQCSREILQLWDDGYITFRYAQHLANGQGLVWNLGGDRVEGYTSILHILLFALGIKLGVQPQVLSAPLSIAAVLVTVLALVWLVRREFKFLHPVGLLLVALYLVDINTAIHSTSGLETQLFVALLCLAYFSALYFYDAPGWLGAVGLAVGIFLATLARPEGFLFGLAWYLSLGLAFLFLTPKSSTAVGLRYLAISAGIVILLGGIYAVSKYAYFGYLLPNTFYVKSNHLSDTAWMYVGYYYLHLVLWFGPLALIWGILAYKTRAWGSFLNEKKLARLLLTLAPVVVASLFYLTIMHETGGAHRFSYPTYFLIVAAMVMLAAPVVESVNLSSGRMPILLLGCLGYLVLPMILQSSWQVAPVPVAGSTQYHAKIANALKATGLGANALVLTDGAGLIPYASGFNQLDRIGLTDNVMSGRQPLSPQAREDYLWGRNPDVYIGFEPPANAGTRGPDNDPRMLSWYVAHNLLTRKLRTIEDRIFLQEPTLLHARMRELRDHWDWVGEIEWTGWQALGVRSFVYVRKGSPYAAVLRAELQKIIDRTPDRINLDDQPDYITKQLVAANP